MDFSLSFRNNVQDRAECNKFSVKCLLVLFLQGRCMLFLVDVKQIPVRTSVLNGICCPFFIIISFKMQQPIGFEACSHHHFGDVFKLHPFQPGCYGIVGDFYGDVVDEHNKTKAKAKAEAEAKEIRLSYLFSTDFISLLASSMISLASELIIILSSSLRYINSKDT